METTFRKLVDYINKQQIGDIIFRKKFLKEIEINGSKNCFDTYRRTLTRNGYLRQCWPGQYRVIKKVPIFLKSDGKNTKETPVGKVLRIWEEASISKEGENLK